MKIKKTTCIFSLTVIIALLSFSNSTINATPLENKVAVLITSWGAPAGFNLEYAWNSHTEHRIGDRTTYPGEPCKIGHVGDFPFQSHVGILPWALTCLWPGFDFLYDTSGIYQLADDIYMPMDPSLPSLPSALIPAGTPIIPVVEDTNPMTDGLMYPPDPRDGKDHLEGWYKIGNTGNPFPNGSGDIYESAPLTFMRWSRIMGGPLEPPDAYLEDIHARTILDRTVDKLKMAFWNKIDVRIGYYGAITGYTKHMRDVAEDFANEGFRKMLIARETTDNNNYANKFMSGNYVKERLCELGVLDATEIYQTRQVGRTPEFNAMNVINLKKFITFECL